LGAGIVGTGLILGGFDVPGLGNHELELYVIDVGNGSIFGRMHLHILAVLHVWLALDSQVSELVNFFHNQDILDLLPQHHIDNIPIQVLDIYFPKSTLGIEIS
jgi:hypothetical protein